MPSVCLAAMSELNEMPRRFPGMDGFRALAALAIVAFHAYLATGWATATSPTDPAFVAGMPDVVHGAFRNLTLRTNVFFVLSGLLLALPFVRWMLIPDASRPGVRRFAVRRFRRIWPLYMLVMLVAAATVSINQTSVEQVVVNALLVQNLAPGGVHLLPVTWTLTVELGFYLLLPLAMLGLAPIVRRLPSLAVRAGLLMSVPVAGIVVGCLVRRSPELSVAGLEPRVTALGYLDNFGAGIFAAIVLVAAFSGSGRLAARVRGMSPLVWTVLGTVLVAIGLRARWDGLDGGRVTTTWWWVTPVAFGVACWMLAVALRPDRSLLARVVGAPALLAIGRISYGIFLWHYVVLHWMSVAGVTRAGGLGAVTANTAIALALTFPLAWASWHLIEEPVLDGRIRLPRPHVPRGLLQLGVAHPRPGEVAP
ncbi:MAG: hypothetical protein JWM86_631 [Thermoleophilia bacterium]|nr:hypothetical protein [Thermoleophilia bacterium]